MSGVEHSRSALSLPWGPVSDPITALVDDLKAVRSGGTIRILSGEASPFVYNHPAVIEAATYAKQQRAAKLRINVGPILVTDGSAFNGVLQLSRTGILDSLTSRPARGHTSHFRIVDIENGYRYYEESPHEPLAPRERRKRLLVEQLPEGHVMELSEAHRVEFDRLTTANGQYERPLLMTPFGLQEITKITKRKRQNFNSLTGPELRTLLEHAEGPWATVRKAADLYPDQWLVMKVAAFDDHRRPWWGKIVGRSRRRSDVTALVEQHLEQQTTRTHAPLYTFHASLGHVLG
jgi:hypothetical protein